MRRVPWLATALLAAGALCVAGCRSADSAGTVELRVLVLDGVTPVDGAQVTARGARESMGLSYFLAPDSGPSCTDASGTVVLAGVEAGEYDVRVEHEAFVCGTWERVTVAESGESSLVVSLRRGARVRGRLLDPSGNPLSGCWVTTTSERPADPDRRIASDSSRSTTTGADGVFLSPALDERWPLRIRGADSNQGRMFFVDARVNRPHEGVNDLGDLRVRDTLTVLRLESGLDRNLWHLNGSIVVADGESGRSTFEIPYASFDGTGRITIVGLPEGRLHWTLHKLGRLRWSIGSDGEGECELSGNVREVLVRRTPPSK